MLININPNVIDAAKKDINAKTALTLLAQIARCGNHIVVSESIAAIRKIQQINGLGVDVKSIYATIEKKLIQYGALKSKISTYAEVTYDNVPPIHKNHYKSKYYNHPNRIFYSRKLHCRYY